MPLREHAAVQVCVIVGGEVGGETGRGRPAEAVVVAHGARAALQHLHHAGIAGQPVVQHQVVEVGVRAVEVEAVSAVSGRGLAAVEVIVGRAALQDLGVERAQRAGTGQFVEPGRLPVAHREHRNRGDGVVIVGPGRAPVRLVPRLGRRHIVAAALDLIGVERIRPVARIETEGHDSAEAEGGGLGDGGVADGRGLGVEAPEIGGQPAGRKLVDGIRSGEPGRLRPGMQRSVERRPELPVQRRPRRSGRERADREMREQPLARAEPGRPAAGGRVDEVDGHPPVAQHAQRLRFVAMHALERDRDRAGVAADRQHAAVCERTGHGAQAGKGHVEGVGVGAVLAKKLPHGRGLGRGDGSGGGRVEGPGRRGGDRIGEIEGERVAQLLHAHGVRRAVAREHPLPVVAEVSFPRRRLPHLRHRGAGAEDVAPSRGQAAFLARRAHRGHVVRSFDDDHRAERPARLDGHAPRGGMAETAAVDLTGDGAAAHQPRSAGQVDLVEERADAAADAERRRACVDGDLVPVLGEGQRCGRRWVRSCRAVEDDAVGRIAVRRNRRRKRDEQPLDRRARDGQAGVPSRQNAKFGRDRRAGGVGDGQSGRARDVETPRKRHAGADDLARPGDPGILANGEQQVAGERGRPRAERGESEEEEEGRGSGCRRARHAQEDTPTEATRRRRCRSRAGSPHRDWPRESPAARSASR